MHFLNENIWISIRISLSSVSKGPINIILTLVQIMAWCRPGDKPLYEPMKINLLIHLCVNWPLWVKHSLRLEIEGQGESKCLRAFCKIKHRNMTPVIMIYTPTTKQNAVTWWRKHYSFPLVGECIVWYNSAGINRRNIKKTKWPGIAPFSLVSQAQVKGTWQFNSQHSLKWTAHISQFKEYRFH